MRVKLILPALTEAESPYWRPIKYSLFPPLGLATLAGFLSDDDEVDLVDQHVEKLELDDEPDLVIIQVFITNAYRAYQIADHYRAQGSYVCLGGLHVTSLPDEAEQHADSIFPRSRRGDLPRVLAGSKKQRTQEALLFRRQDAGWCAPGQTGSDQTPQVPGAELARRDAGLPTSLQFLLQGRILYRRQVLLHPTGRRRVGRDRTVARPTSLFLGRPPAGQPAIRRVIVRGHERDESRIPGCVDRGCHPARRPD